MNWISGIGSRYETLLLTPSLKGSKVAYSDVAQHLDMLSMVPGYRRTTRWKSSDGSKPRFLAKHELDALNVDAHTMGVLTSTVWAMKIIAGAKTFESSTYGVILEKGNSKDAIGS